MARLGLGIAAFLAALSVPEVARADEAVAVILDNGIVVLMQPVKDAGGVALAIAVPYGRADDPENQEGRAEVVLRAIILAKAGTAPERTADTLQSVDRIGPKYLLEIGRSCSCFAVRDTAEGLPALLTDAAARFTALEPSEGLLSGIRERLGVWRDGALSKSSTAASVFRARLDALPEPRGNQPFGTEEGVRAVSLDAVGSTARATLATHGAVVAIVGAFDAAKVRQLVKKTLGAIPASDRPAPAAAASPAAAPAPTPVDPAHVDVHGPAATKKDAALALAGPPPTDLAGLAAWLVLVSRLCERGAVASGPGAFIVSYYPGTEPGLVTLRRTVAPGEDDAGAVAPLKAAVAEARAGAVSAKDTLAVRKWPSVRLGLAAMELAGAFSLLDRAYGLATMRLHGWDGQAAVDVVKKVKIEQISEIVDKAMIRTAIAVPQ